METLPVYNENLLNIPDDKKLEYFPNDEEIKITNKCKTVAKEFDLIFLSKIEKLPKNKYYDRDARAILRERQRYNNFIFEPLFIYKRYQVSMQFKIVERKTWKN